MKSSVPAKPRPARRPKILVVGSLNLDYIASVERLPVAGQTVAAGELVRRFGGKGANQAVAAARQGAQVSMLGCVGADADGRAYLQRLRREGIDASGVRITRKSLTGTALIAVDQSAENLIVVAAGANGQVSPAGIRAERARFLRADAVLLQLEIPLPSVVESLRLANRAQVPVILNPSPLQAGFPWGDWPIEALIVNEGEAETIFGLALAGLSTEIDGWRRGLTERRVQRLIITRGAQPTVYLAHGSLEEIPTLPVRPVDTVGAGDAFAGAFAARWARERDTLAAIRHANCAGALATLKPGAQEAIPNRASTQRALRRLGPRR